MKKISSITKDTICCISIASKPGNFGSLIFNRTFKTLNLDYIYKPFCVVPKDLSTAVQSIRVFGIKGCGVSMPHKTVMYKYLDRVDKAAKEIGAVNTIVNEKGFLTGYNTDVIGVEKALGLFYKVKGKSAHIIGTGGAARAVIVALKKAGCKRIVISARDNKKAQKLAKEFFVEYSLSEKRTSIQADILINATPVGMTPNTKDMIVAKDEIKNYSAVMDVVVSPLTTTLIQEAKKQKKVVIPGYIMALHQAAAQFTLYTNKEAPIPLMTKYVKAILKEK